MGMDAVMIGECVIFFFAQSSRAIAFFVCTFTISPFDLVIYRSAVSTLTFFFLPFGRSAATPTLKTVRTSESLLSYIDIRPAVAIIIFWGFSIKHRARRFVRAIAAS
jgi:hypothetical protein